MLLCLYSVITESKQAQAVAKKPKNKCCCLAEVSFPLSTFSSLLQSGIEHRQQLFDALQVEVNAECTFFQNREPI